MAPDPLGRLAKKINKTETCWLWTGAVTVNGYGNSGRMVHRIVYERLVGPIPDGMTLDHLCRVRICCNPAHLEPMTQRENNLRAPRWASDRCIRGHLYGPQTASYEAKGIRRCRECHNMRQRMYNRGLAMRKG